MVGMQESGGLFSWDCACSDPTQSETFFNNKLIHFLSDHYGF